MIKTRTAKIVGVYLPFKIIAEIERLAPSLDAKTVSDACRKMILSFLRFRGVEVPDELFENRAGARSDLLTPEGRARQRAIGKKTVKFAREALAKKRALAALEKLRSEKVSEGVPKIKIKARKSPKKPTRRAA